MRGGGTDATHPPPTPTHTHTHARHIESPVEPHPDPRPHLGVNSSHCLCSRDIHKYIVCLVEVASGSLGNS